MRDKVFTHLRYSIRKALGLETRDEWCKHTHTHTHTHTPLFEYEVVTVLESRGREREREREREKLFQIGTTQ